MGQFSREILDLTGHVFARAAAEQAGVLSGENPASYNRANPIRLWVIQVVIIIFTTQILSLALGRIRQPRVIAEVIGGVILGPTIMGRIPGFRSTIFPDDAMPLLNLTSTIGLVLFLFLVGLEIDTRVIKRNIAASAVISLAGLIFPLGLGAALGVGIYREFINPEVNFGYFLLFVAVAVGITAFPVLCRILTELKLLDTTVGVVVLSAGVGNDVIGWILLALTVALVNASSGLTALWVLLVCVGYVLFLLYPIRWAYVWLARRTGSLEQGSPTALMMTVTLLVTFISAFFTDIIGVHAIFGGFLAGLIIPHDNGFAISLVEKLEDLVSILFLPIYFTLSGLRTNLGLLDNGVTWGYTIIICLVAFTSKFVACGAAALQANFNWREAGAIGSLMSCKGLVELIVLNVGLQARILDDRTFSMFVVHALILTFITTPLTLLFYPEKYRKHEGSATKQKPTASIEDGIPYRKPSEDEYKTKFSVILDKIDQLPAAMMLSQLVNVPCNKSTTALSPTKSLGEKEKDKDDLIESVDITPSQSPSPSSPHETGVTIDALRLIELTNRTSAVLKSQEAESLIYNDPVVSVFRTFGNLNKLSVSAALSVVNYDEFPDAIARHVANTDSQMVILPWSRGSTSVYEDSPQEQDTAKNPFDGVFHKSNLHIQDQTSSVVYSEFIRGVFLKSPVDVALFVDRGLSNEVGPVKQHLFLPFFGGPDDRLALSFLVQLCHNPSITATVIRIRKVEELSPLSTIAEAKGVTAALASPPVMGHGNTHMTVAAADTVYGHQSTQTRMASDTADSILWEKYTSNSQVHSPSLSNAISRITFNTESSTTPLHTVIELAQGLSSTAAAGKSLIVILGRSRRMAIESHQSELRQVMTETGGHMGSSVPKTMGDVGAALVAKGIHTSLFVVQAATGA